MTGTSTAQWDESGQRWKGYPEKPLPEPKKWRAPWTPATFLALAAVFLGAGPTVAGSFEPDQGISVTSGPGAESGGGGGGASEAGDGQEDGDPGTVRAEDGPEPNSGGSGGGDGSGSDPGGQGGGTGSRAGEESGPERTPRGPEEGDTPEGDAPEGEEPDGPSSPQESPSEEPGPDPLGFTLFADGDPGWEQVVDSSEQAEVRYTSTEDETLLLRVMWAEADGTSPEDAVEDLVAVPARELEGYEEVVPEDGEEEGREEVLLEYLSGTGEEDARRTMAGALAPGNGLVYVLVFSGPAPEEDRQVVEDHLVEAVETFELSPGGAQAD
ncbi:hypothetical protein [Nocardiopsis algeriensis]|uniref:Uncharacterized protein n=1 Tax=Nocardiopsis algeriensis TaxID=1478215 RepID=A0A841IT36_9ACTN|nr:hypothetical protein [Nocardiopsis algeriensis]MBB6121322.1 hypothetical protein [Nocardiopsis algeriensis]